MSDIEKAEQLYLQQLSEIVADPGLWSKRVKNSTCKSESMPPKRSVHAIDARKNKFNEFVTNWKPPLVPNQSSLLGYPGIQKDICRGSQ
jgi:hypothetical protein